MILAYVLVGCYVIGNEKLKALPEDADSAVNDVNDPSIYVIFKDTLHML